VRSDARPTAADLPGRIGPTSPIIS
jgi:hypothetical protein